MNWLSPSSQTSIFTWGSAPRVHFYYSGNTQYICDAEYWSALSDPVRRVKKLVFTDTTFNTLVDVYWANAGWHDQLATDLATVQALSYS